jgi:hypothetical protein
MESNARYNVEDHVPASVRNGRGVRVAGCEPDEAAWHFSLWTKQGSPQRLGCSPLGAIYGTVYALESYVPALIGAPFPRSRPRG